MSYYMNENGIQLTDNIITRLPYTQKTNSQIHRIQQEN